MFGEGNEAIVVKQMAVGQNQWHHFGVGEFTTHFRTDLSGWIGLFTGVTGFRPIATNVGVVKNR